jgi:hypothetical protein
MTNVLKPHDYDKSVFINCPFDGAYEPLFHGLIFAVHHMKQPLLRGLFEGSLGWIRSWL